MAKTEAEVEALALTVMRAWVAGDAKALKKATARDLMIMVGTLPPQLLDRPSFLAAVERGFTCTRFAFREVFVRQHGKTAWFVAGAELEFQLGPRTWSGRFLVTQLWRCGTIGGWKLADLSLARLDEGERYADSIRALQLWK
jgi:ketosteroid isomerase-like protein